MMLSHRWISELVDLGGRSPEELARLLTFHIAEVEELIRVGDHLDDVIVGHVVDVAPHPDADRLRICTVDAGHDATHTVVCGAPNVAAGQRVCFAPVGTTLTTADGSLTLDRRAIRGVESAGMICAEDELGLGTDHDGILVLADDSVVGTPVADVLGIRDTVIEVGNTAITHRPDLWGHAGFARDLGAVLRADVTRPGTEAADAAIAAATGAPYPVTIEDEEGCRRYVGLVLEGVHNGRAPLWMRQRLESLDVRSIDLLVDLTNFVLLEQGQPLHAFDLRALRGDRIVVRRGGAAETMRCLDGVERQVGPEDVVIADAERAVALAGVMGGEDSGMAPDTTAILLEAATFDPVRIRRTSQRVGLRTEASSRFEKTLDPELAMAATRRFAELALAHCPGSSVAAAPTDCYPRPYPAITVDLPYRLAKRRLGLRLSDMQLKRTLSRLGFKSEERDDVLRVSVPSWRATKDIEGPMDLVEEVGRVSGYEGLPPVVPITTVEPTIVPPERDLERRLAAVLSLTLGYAEVKGYSFYGAKDAELLGLGETPHIQLSHPLSEAQDRMIQSSVVNMLRVVERNMVREPQGRAWECTRLFPPTTNGLPDELPIAAIVAWDAADEDAQPGALLRSAFADLRAVLARLGVREARTADAEPEALAPGLPAPSWLHPGRCAAVHSAAGGHLLAVGGEIAPRVLRARGLTGRVVCIEVHLPGVLAASTGRGSAYNALLRYPVVPFDVSLLVPRRTPAERVADVIAGAVEGHVRGVRAFDSYEGEGVPEGQRSLAFTCELYDRDATLTSKAADALRAKIIAALDASGWHVRTA